MKTKTKQPRTIVPIANKAAAGKNSRLPNKPEVYWGWAKSKYF